ncbi:MAG: hypothetical protein V1799_01810 [bacterium]
MKKKIIILTSLLIMSIVSLRLYSYYYRNSLPNIRLTDVHGQTIKMFIFDHKYCSFFLIQTTNYFIKTFFKDINKFNLTTNQKLIFFINANDTINTKSSQNIFVFRLDNDKWKHLRSYFYSVKEVENVYLSYNQNGDLESILPIEPINKEKIIRNIEKNTMYSNNDSLLNSMINKIKRYAFYQEDGFYYYVSFFSPNCICYNTFKDIERILKENKRKLRVKLLGNWSDIDVQNLTEERNHDIFADLAQKEISILYDEWEQNTARNDFNLILIKNKFDIIIFPLIKDEDYKSWNDFKKNGLRKYLE